ncbi:hypothetical protein [Mangrovibacter phragmitis]|uniref:hypothetical protein n=1 Tax=Mangrovibacter phragmitis TaxID=1691903 RepID=UPI003519C735
MAKILPTLERNIIKYRSMQILIFSFYIEDFKRKIISSLKVKLIYNNLEGYKNEIAPSNMGDAMDMLERKNILSKEDRAEYAKLIKYRNQTSHEIELMFLDLVKNDAEEIYKTYKVIKYDYEAIEKIKKLRDKVLNKLSRELILSINLRENMFELIEGTYFYEMKKLEVAIEKGIINRKKMTDK